MPVAHRFVDFISDLQRLERLSLPGEASRILDAFTRHTPYHGGALYLRDGRDPAAMRLAAKSQHFVAPEILDAPAAKKALNPDPHVVVPLRNNREELGLL